MSDDGFRIRTMSLQEVALAVDWAAAEGWNPGHADADCFASADPGGFLIGEHQGAVASTLSVVNYDQCFAFLGFYIVRPDLRGRGLGLRTWQAGIAHAGTRTIGLGGVAATLRAPSETVPLSNVPFDLIERDDATVFPAARRAFLRTWIAAPGHVGHALLRNGRLAAWGVIRPCRRGRKIGPLVADDRTAAEVIFAALLGAEGGEIFLDVPQPNRDAVAVAVAHGLAPVFETARMYSGPIRSVRLDRIFGVTTFELG
jgi:hypothetical protein